jgi:hypothetical protein
MSGLTSLEICEKEEYMLNIAKGLARDGMVVTTTYAISAYRQ